MKVDTHNIHNIQFYNYSIKLNLRELVNPSEVVVTSGHEVYLAQPVITPIERLRRKDKVMIMMIMRI